MCVCIYIYIYIYIYTHIHTHTHTHTHKLCYIVVSMGKPWGSANTNLVFVFSSEVLLYTKLNNFSLKSHFMSFQSFYKRKKYPYFHS